MPVIAIPFILLFLVGLLLSIIFSITNLVLAFQESLGWGFLTLFVPFAAWVFSIKFWDRKWVRRSFLYSIGGAVMAFISAIGMSLTLPSLLQQADRARLAKEATAYEEVWQEVDLNETEVMADTTSSVSQAPFYDGVNYAIAAAELTQTAESSADWAEVAETWENAIAMMAAVPADHPQFAVAQAKVDEYQNNLAYASQNAQQ